MNHHRAPIVQVSRADLDAMFAEVHQRHGMTVDEGRRRWQAGTLADGGLRDLWLIWGDEVEGERA